MSGLPLKILIIIGAALYYASLSLYFFRKHRTANITSNVVYIAAWTINFAVVVNNFILNGYVPFVSMFQVLTFIAMLFGPVFIYMSRVRGHRWMKPYFLAASAILMTGLCFMNADAVTEFRPALRSPWFLPHVLVYTTAYTLGFISFLIVLIRFVTNDPEKKKELNAGVYDAVCMTFALSTLGMFIGAIWANEVWGAFWSWDSKENWALITWLSYMLYLHFRRSKKLAKYANILIVLGFLCIIITLFFSGSSSHAYL